MASNKGTIVVTGANGGLGTAIAAQIASKPELSVYHGIYTVRDATAAPALVSAIAHGDPSHAHAHDILSLELTDLENVRKVADGINARVSAGEIPPIRALILSAGLQDFGKQSWTADGLDKSFGSNYLGHWLLALLLLRSIDKVAGRIVVIGSQSHDPSDPRNTQTKAFVEKYKTLAPDDAAGFEAVAKGTWSSAAEDPSWRSGYRRYGASKLFTIMMVYELQERLGRDEALRNVSVLGVDPGTMATNLQRLAPWIIRVLLFRIIYPLISWLNPNSEVMRPTARSAGDVLEAAVGAVGVEGGPPKGLYFNSRELADTSAESKDAGKRRFVWTETVKYAGLKEGDTVLSNWQ